MVIVSDILLPKDANGILKVSDVHNSEAGDLSCRVDIADPTTSTFVKTDAVGRLNVLESSVEGVGADNSLNATQYAVKQVGAFDGTAFRSVKCSNVGRLEVDINSGGGGGDASAANQTNGNQKSIILGNDGNDGVGTNRIIKCDADGTLRTHSTLNDIRLGNINTKLSDGNQITQILIPSKTELDVFTLSERTVPIGSVTSTNTLELKGTGKVCITIHSDTTNHSAILRLSNDGTNFFSPSSGASFNPSGTGFLLVAEFDNIAKLAQVTYSNTSGGTAVISQAKLVY